MASMTSVSSMASGTTAAPSAAASPSPSVAASYRTTRTDASRRTDASGRTVRSQGSIAFDVDMSDKERKAATKALAKKRKASKKAAKKRKKEAEAAEKLLKEEEAKQTGADGLVITVLTSDERPDDGTDAAVFCRVQGELGLSDALPLKRCVTGGDCHPYIKLTLGTSQIRRTRAARQQRAPHWSQTLIFDCEEVTLHRLLTVDVIGATTEGVDVPLASITVNTMPLDDGIAWDKWHTIGEPAVLAACAHLGEEPPAVRLQITRVAARLEVVCVEARGLLIKDLEMKPALVQEPFEAVVRLELAEAQEVVTTGKAACVDCPLFEHETELKGSGVIIAEQMPITLIDAEDDRVIARGVADISGFNLPEEVMDDTWHELTFVPDEEQKALAAEAGRAFPLPEIRLKLTRKKNGNLKIKICEGRNVALLPTQAAMTHSLGYVAPRITTVADVESAVKARVFEAGDSNTFEFQTTGDLGKLTRLKIWHNGKGKSVNWGLRKVVVVHGTNLFTFICDERLVKANPERTLVAIAGHAEYITETRMDRLRAVPTAVWTLGYTQLAFYVFYVFSAGKLQFLPTYAAAPADVLAMDWRAENRSNVWRWLSYCLLQTSLVPLVLAYWTQRRLAVNFEKSAGLTRTAAILLASGAGGAVGAAISRTSSFVGGMPVVYGLLYSWYSSFYQTWRETGKADMKALGWPSGLLAADLLYVLLLVPPELVGAELLGRGGGFVAGTSLSIVLLRKLQWGRSEGAKAVCMVGSTAVLSAVLILGFLQSLLLCCYADTLLSPEAGQWWE